ncbi:MULTISPECIES: sensor histidine kinase [unclassified Coleofasciculus]|uniref:sensor histidine kinase n=1 Tax=unclassified Coleofasciculus TaxID=2692782 RepID=UPI00187FFF22|nr:MULTISPECIES: HAMP domain-containing sensor histidine kinase [unclassified Coleofasciculus]MBE9128576.1 sensor histidine kinase [Coleofasciculus sp. LEGE 07081]MBE9147929.1 sensor histidine kinase [Coleofasciculus sp. LEGE 07092]
MELIYLVVGIIAGLVGSRFTRSRQESVISTPSPVPKEAVPPEKEFTQLQPLEEELKQAQLAYEMAHEMSQFKAGFLARTSHELRSPLSSLMGLHQLILCDLCDSPEEEREFVTQANVSAQKMVKLLDEMISVSKTEHGTNHLEIRPLPLSKVFEELELLTHMQAANRNLQLTVISPEEEIQVVADYRRFRQVLVGIVDSAIVQMEEGSIQVSATSAPDSQEVHVWIDVECPNSIWNESVDLFSKIEESETQPNQTDEVSPGRTLLMVQTLLEVMQGRLELLANPSPEKNVLRLQCSIPLGNSETVEQGLVVD